MVILITGANGFLGYYLCAALMERGYDVVATGKGNCRLPYLAQPHFTWASMDYTDPFAVHDVFEKYQPEVVVHAGAISKPDDCETNQWMAYVNNVEGTVTLLTNADALKSYFVFVSTDFIFDGQKGMYKEDNDAAPVNYYGQTKLEAEDAVKEYEHDWVIARTVLVYGEPHDARDNLLTIVRRKLEAGEEYKVFDDQVRTPTYVGDLADGIVSIIQKRKTGIFHLSGEEILTPYEMAIRAANFLGLDASLIMRATANDFQQVAKRPLKTGFDITKAKKELDFQPLSFEEGLRRTFRKA